MSLVNRVIAATLPGVPKPIVRQFSKRYIAGETLEDVIRVVKELNAQGYRATIDVLGEHVQGRQEAEEAREAYRRVLQVIHDQPLDSNISVKLTQMGLKLDKELCYQSLRLLCEMARGYSNFVRIDMEDSTCTSDTIELFLRLRRDFDNVGIALQAYLRRSLQDVQSLIAHRANVRLCKGIYREPRTIAYKEREIINRNFTLLLEELLRKGCYVGIATHDEKLVWEAYRLIHQLKLQPTEYEFQMLLGVDEELRRIIVSDGHPLRVYVPFGLQWYAYSVRRLRENPEIARYVLKNLFGG